MWILHFWDIVAVYTGFYSSWVYHPWNIIDSGIVYLIILILFLNISRWLKCIIILIFYLLLNLLLLLLLLLPIFLKSLLQICFLDIPVVHEIKFISVSHKGFSKHRYQLLVIWFLFEFELPWVIQEMLKFFRKPSAQLFNWCHCLLYFYLLIFLFFCFRRKSLPWQNALQEIHQYHSDLLKIIPPWLFYSEMCIQACISSCSS